MRSQVQASELRCLHYEIVSMSPAMVLTLRGWNSPGKFSNMIWGTAEVQIMISNMAVAILCYRGREFSCTDMSLLVLCQNSSSRSLSLPHYRCIHAYTKLLGNMLCQIVYAPIISSLLLVSDFAACELFFSIFHLPTQNSVCDCITFLFLTFLTK